MKHISEMPVLSNPKINDVLIIHDGSKLKMQMNHTAIQQAIVMVRSREESMLDTLMGKHTAHHLQQIERGLYELLEAEKEQIIDAYNYGQQIPPFEYAEQYYNETYKQL
jgi:hypothetical protein